jgi:hypothetical protein
MARLHAMIGEQLGDDAESEEVRVGIETDRGLWVMALAAAGYAVYGASPLQVARYRERQGCRELRATPPTRTSWRTWCAPMPISCAR